MINFFLLTTLILIVALLYMVQSKQVNIFLGKHWENDYPADFLNLAQLPNWLIAQTISLCLLSQYLTNMGIDVCLSYPSLMHEVMWSCDVCTILCVCSQLCQNMHLIGIHKFDWLSRVVTCVPICVVWNFLLGYPTEPIRVPQQRGPLIFLNSWVHISPIECSSCWAIQALESCSMVKK